MNKKLLTVNGNIAKLVFNEFLVCLSVLSVSVVKSLPSS